MCMCVCMCSFTVIKHAEALNMFANARENVLDKIVEQLFFQQIKIFSLSNADNYLCNIRF